MEAQKELQVTENGMIDNAAKEVDSSPTSLIAQAIQRDVPVETMEKLLSMRRELEEEQARKAYFRDLSQFQAECPEIPKTKRVMNKDGKTVRYTYAPLDEIVKHTKGLLKQYGFSYTIHSEQTDDRVTGICRTHHTAGHTEETYFTVPIDPEAYMNDQQKVASALSYAKRIAFVNAFGILTTEEDDDAQSMSFDAGRKYAEWLDALDAISDLEELKDTARKYHSDLKGRRDHEGAKVIHTYYTRRKAELEESNE